MKEGINFLRTVIGCEAKHELTKPPTQNPRDQLRGNFYRELLFGFFVLGLLKIGAGGPRCVTYFFGGPGMCEKLCDRGGGSKLTKNSGRTLWTATHCAK